MAFLAAAGMAEARDLALADGAVVTSAVVGEEHDDLEGGRSRSFTTYRFAAFGHPETAQTTIELSMGAASP